MDLGVSRRLSPVKPTRLSRRLLLLRQQHLLRSLQARVQFRLPLAPLHPPSRPALPRLPPVLILQLLLRQVVRRQLLPHLVRQTARHRLLAAPRVLTQRKKPFLSLFLESDIFVLTLSILISDPKNFAASDNKKDNGATGFIVPLMSVVVGIVTGGLLVL